MKNLESLTQEELIFLVQKLSKENKDLQKKAFVDPLTQLHNRQSYNDHLEIKIDSAKRYGEALSMIVIDLDHFKSVNDTYGHQMGDEVLKNTADIIKKNTRKADISSRFGGEEMVIILPHTTKTQAAIVAEHIRVALESIVYQYKGEKFEVTASFGVASYEKGMTKEELFEKADSALYSAKEQGRNRVGIAANNGTSFKEGLFD